MTTSRYSGTRDTGGALAGAGERSSRVTTVPGARSCGRATVDARGAGAAAVAGAAGVDSIWSTGTDAAGVSAPPHALARTAHPRIATTNLLTTTSSHSSCARLRTSSSATDKTWRQPTLLPTSTGETGTGTVVLRELRLPQRSQPLALIRVPGEARAAILYRHVGRVRLHPGGLQALRRPHQSPTGICASEFRICNRRRPADPWPSVTT
jgi:hypothetical protein